ncbi:lipocalin-like domain-containing protein [Chitinophaga japonensis]|uniref:Lipocalin-like protein n=1 Tax=Chitinophaga japonensis TaxID=104662 RepID=A0A562SRZ3_CHIJA|nr:lipocalin-like domain-containing protein [Chitinophaga japonensis]TWI84011.1 lipocalin-like protein [Chitinophaga japonensis]
MKKGIVVILFSLPLFSSIAGAAQTRNKTAGSPLAGTWVLEAAEVLHPDGTRVTDTAYGTNAKGLLMVDDEGQYSLQIFRPDRPRFASGDKKRGTPQEYEAACLGISTHTGHIFVDTAQQTLQFKIDYAAYPNWEHTTQIRQYKFTGNMLSYQVPATAGAGRIAISVWRRVK